MKNLPVVPLLIILTVFFTSTQFGCSSTANSSSSTSQSAQDYGYTDLLQMLRKESGLRISGSATNPEIRVTGGGKSIAGSEEPLFVMDGITLGRGYNSVRNIDVNTVKSIRVVSAARAGIYGARGGNGVIEITTK